MSKPPRTCQDAVDQANTHVWQLLEQHARPALTVRIMSHATVNLWAVQMYNDARRGNAEATLESARGFYAAVRAVLARETGTTAPTTPAKETPL